MTAPRMGKYQKSERTAQVAFVRARGRAVRVRRAIHWFGLAALSLGIGFVIVWLLTCGGG